MKLHASDRVALELIVSAAIYELTAEQDDMLSDCSHRYVARYPKSGRLVILVTALHLAKLLPPWLDPYHNTNLVARRVLWILARFPRR